ncbi:MAG TPA: ABC transporter permease [Solirubrobacteraceae bacterium]|jgi:putative ABC transport system permease protein
MTRVALRGLAGRKLRSALTALAIVLGVAMVSGTFVLTDTIDRGFDAAYTQSYDGSDVVISERTSFGQEQAGPGGFPAGVLDQVRRLPEVKAAAGGIVDTARLIDRHGDALGKGGVPPMAFGLDGEEAGDLNPLVLAGGAWPSGPGEVAIDRAAAEDAGYRVGDAIRVATRGPARSYRIAGIVRLGELDSIGGATIAVFDLATAQRLFAKAGRLDLVRVTGDGDVGTGALQRAIAPHLPAAAQVRSGLAQAKAESADTSDGLAFLRYFLLAFGAIALLVGGFVIANTLSITIAQRTRELATLRTLGGSRRQVLTSVIVEALAVGAVASVAGLFLGLGLAKGLGALLAGIGIDLPDDGAVLTGRTVVVSLLVGILITLLAALRPAVRATRVPPIAAVREGAVLPPGRFGRLGGALTARVVRAAVRVLGWPSARLGGPAGALAARNATRNPGRTASTAAALMIGLALVTFVAVLANGLRSSFVDSVDELFTADYALTAETGFPALAPEAERAVARAPGVAAVAGVRSGKAKLDGKDLMISAVGPRIAQTLRIDWDQGSDAVPAQLGDDGVFVTRKWADERGLRIGSPLVLSTPTGTDLRLTVRGIWNEPKGGSPFGDVAIGTAAFDRTFPNPRNDFTFVEMEAG